MIVTKNTPLSAIEYTETIFINKEVSLDTQFLEQIMQTFPLSKIVIQTYDLELHTSLESSVLYTNEELGILVQNTELAKNKYNKDLSFDDGFSVEQAIQASTKINDMAEMINSLTINGEPLSQLEKYTIAYSLITKKLYTKSESVQGSRNVISVLTGDEIVCAGFASALATLCTKIGVPCTYRGCTVEENNELDSHAICTVRIEDDKYNVHGVFNADPTWDCVKKDFEEILDFDHNLIFKHFLLASSEYSQIYPNITLDCYSKTLPDGTQTRAKIKIPNIDALYPEKRIQQYKNPTIYNKATHDIDISEIKRQALTRLIESFPITENLKRKVPPDSNIEALIEPIINHLIEETVCTPPQEKTEIIDFIARFYKYLNASYTVEEIKELLAERIVNFPDEKIISEYVFMEKSNINKNHYTEYMQEFLVDKVRTKPISKETLKALFGNLLPIMFNFENGLTPEILEEMLTNYTPLALSSAIKQKSQE